MQFDKTQSMNKTIKGAMLRRKTDVRDIPCLVVILGKDAGRRFELQKGDNTIGRANAHITINDPELSRTHFCIDFADNMILVEDLNSTNGTYVNGSKIVDKVEISPALNIQAGQTIFKIEFKSRSELSFENKMIKDATLDGLTGIMNKTCFMGVFKKILEKAVKEKTNIAVILIDLDKFKLVNDNFGHLAGDLVLKKFAELVANNKRKNDIFARFGGEEFIALLEGPRVSAKVAMHFAERVRKNVESYCFMYEKKRIPVTISLGIDYVESPTEVIEPKSIIKNADTALYAAKKSGRNKSIQYQNIAGNTSQEL